ncbi:MAG: hypothetical protein ACI4QJ_05685 [Candidatus Spyradenecus sp.]
MTPLRTLLLLALLPLAFALRAEEEIAIGKLNDLQRQPTPEELLIQAQARQVYEASTRQLGEQRKVAAERRAAKAVEIAEADAWAAKLLQLTPAQVNAWMKAPVKDEATYAQIAAMSDAQLEAAERGGPAEPPAARRWGALGLTVALLLAWAIWKHLKKGARE